MGGLPVERLRDYLRQLPLGVRARLIAELERAAARGDDIPGGAAVLEEVRGTMQESAPPRRGTPRELFFKAVEPFLVDDPVEQKQRGRIARSAIDRIWSWIGRDLAPAEATIFCDETGRALIADDAAMCEHLVCDFHRCVVAKIQAVIAHTAGDDRARRRLIGQVGTAQPLSDVADLVTILSARETLAFVESRLPTQIRNLAESHLETVKALLDSPPCSQRGLLPYILIMVSGRLVAPWQLIRLAVSSAESDDATRIAAFPYACAVDIVLADIERTVGWLKAELRRGATDSVVALMRHIHDGARGLRTELDLSGDTPWTRRLAAIRTDVSDVLKAEIESAPGRVRRLLRPRPASEIARHSMLDASEVADTEALIELVGACRNYASELAISEMTLRAYSEVQHHLDTGTRSLLDGLRHAGDADRRFRQSQVDAAVRFCAKVFGQEYASLLGKAAEVAANAAGERKASRQGLIHAVPAAAVSAIKGRLRLAGRRDVNPS